MAFRNLSRDDGSIPLALLAIIITSAVLSVVLVRTVAEGRATVFDSSYSASVHVAEAGIDAAAFRLNNKLFDPNASTFTGSGATDGRPYSYTANRQADGSWGVNATGAGSDSVDRSLRVRLVDRPFFNVALATQQGVALNGNNSADSYDASKPVSQYCSLRFDGSDAHNVNCFGIVASNGPIDMKNANNPADRVQVHDWATNKDNRCQPLTTYHCVPPTRENFDEKLNLGAQIPFVEGLITAHCPASPPSLVREKDAFTLDPTSATIFGSQASAPPVEVNTRLTYVRCLTQLSLTKKAVVELSANVTPGTPMILLVKQRIEVDASTLNCVGCDGNNFAGPAPFSRRLTIMSLTGDLPAGPGDLAGVRFKDAHIGAAIYVPNATCGGNQNGIYGSLICARIDNTGGWKFHYDEDLARGLSSGEYVVTRWSEE